MTSAVISGPRPGFTLGLLLAAAALVMAGGIELARRGMEHRIPADRMLLRESGASLQAELSRLDQVYTGHLQRLAQSLASGTSAAEVRKAAADVEGIASFAILAKDGSRQLYERIGGPASLPPDPELLEEGKRPNSPFALGIPVKDVFGKAQPSGLPANAEGWVGRPDSPWLAWWQRIDAARVVVILVRGPEIRKLLRQHINGMLPTVWAPVRAAGGLDFLQGPGDIRITSGDPLFHSPPDFVIPLTSRLGHWQIVSYDRWEKVTTWHQPTLILAGILAVGLALLGLLISSAQRRVLREVSARVSFVNRVSHELGAPLTNLRLYMELAQDALPSGAGESHRRLAVAQEETERLSRLVRNVLTFARSGNGTLELPPAACRPGELVLAVLDQFAPALARRGIVVETAVDTGLQAILHPDAFSQIVANLVSNVEKYAASGGWMEATLEGAGEELILRITDRGPGIPPSESIHVFQPFARLDSRLTEGVSGTGLGLSINQDLVTRMHGSITLAAAPRDTGCIFTVRLPLHPSGSTALPAASPELHFQPA